MGPNQRDDAADGRGRDAPVRGRFTWTTLGPWTWITLFGDFSDTTTADGFHAAAVELATRERDLILDLSRVSAAGVELVSALLDAELECSRRGNWCTVVVASTPCRSELSRLRADKRERLGLSG